MGKYAFLIFISTLALESTGQSTYGDLSGSFYKSDELFKKDMEVYELFKKSRRRNRTATTLGVLSIASIGLGTYTIIGLESTGQSADLGIVVSALGLYSIGIATGVTALLYKTTSMNSKKKTISLYREKFGTGFIMNDRDNKDFALRINLNGNGLGMIVSF